MKSKTFLGRNPNNLRTKSKRLGKTDKAGKEEDWEGEGFPVPNWLDLTGGGNVLRLMSGLPSLQLHYIAGQSGMMKTLRVRTGVSPANFF